MCASSASSRRLVVFSVGSALLSVTVGSTNAGRTANSRSETENDFLACDGKDLQHEIAAFPFEHAVERQFARLASWDEQTVAVVAFIEKVVAPCQSQPLPTCRTTRYCTAVSSVTV